MRTIMDNSRKGNFEAKRQSLFKKFEGADEILRLLLSTGISIVFCE